MKYNVLLLVLFVLSIFSFNFGYSYEEPISEREIDELIKSSQQENAELDIQLETDEIIYNLKKEKQLDISDAMFGLIKGLFLVIFDLIKLGVLFFLMHFILYFFVNTIPGIFSSLVNMFANIKGGKNE